MLLKQLIKSRVALHTYCLSGSSRVKLLQWSNTLPKGMSTCQNAYKSHHWSHHILCSVYMTHVRGVVPQRALPSLGVSKIVFLIAIINFYVILVAMPL